MSRVLSSDAYNSLYASETDDVFITLITISHVDMASSIRVSSDAVNTLSRGDTFLSFPFELVLPDDREGKSPYAQLVIDNVSRMVVQSIREIRTAPTVLIEIIRAADTEVVEASFPDFKLVNVKYNALTIEGELTIEDFTAEPYPSGVFTPKDFPALF